MILATQNDTALYRHIGQRLKEGREEAGKTQREVAELLGITVAAYQRYESGQTRVPAAALYRLARAFDTGPGWFFMGFRSP